MEVLYIEDNPTNIKLMQMFFAQQEQGVTLHIAQTAKAGLEKLSQQLPSLILMDIELPDLNGEQLVMKIKHDSHFKHIPVVAVTAMAMESDIERAESLFDYYLSKPIDFIELKRVMDYFYGEHKSGD